MSVATFVPTSGVWWGSYGAYQKLIWPLVRPLVLHHSWSSCTSIWPCAALASTACTGAGCGTSCEHMLAHVSGRPVKCTLRPAKGVDGAQDGSVLHSAGGRNNVKPWR